MKIHLPYTYMQQNGECILKTMAADAMAPHIAQSSAVLILIMYDTQFDAFLEGGNHIK